MSILKNFIGALALTLGVASVANADSYPGSACSFADNPLASHNKIHHRLVNTSGAQQWVTCPAVRRKTGNLSSSALFSSSGIAFARIEIRTGGGTLAGWDAEAAPRSSVTGGFLSDWFTSINGSASAGAQVSFEALINNNAFINGYTLSEV